MESFLPKCECGADVHVEIYHVPHYDDGGGLETVEEEYDFWSSCYDCSVNEPPVDFWEPRLCDDESELPF